MSALYPKTESTFPHDTHPELPLDPDVIQPGIYKWPPHFTPLFLLFVFIGGTGGAAARYWVTTQLTTTDSGWPVSTLFVNVLGASLLGLLLEGLARLGADMGVRRLVRLTVGTGFMGAFTTFSTFAAEIDLLIKHHHSGVAIGYGLTSVVGGIVFCVLGIQIAAIHHKRREAQQ